MDSQKREELRERRREEALARRMGEALDRFSPREAGDCPEADIIAAYHERALEPEEAAQWESHFAGCARCRKVLAVLAASLDAPLAENEVARLGKLVAAAVRTPGDAASQKLTPIRPSRWDWRARWLAPALGVAAVLAIWFAVRPPWRATAPESSGTLIAQAPKDEVAPNAVPREADRLSKVAPQSVEKPVAPIPRSKPSTITPSINSPAGTPAERRAETGNAIGKSSPNSEVDTGALQKEKKIDSLANESAPSLPAAPPPPPPQVPKTETEGTPARAASQAQTSTNTMSAGVARGDAASRDNQAPAPQVAGGAAASPQFSSRAALNGRANKDLSLFKSTPETSASMKSPSGSTSWRAGKGGSIERSTDAGRTFTAETSPSHEDWLAVAAVSDTVGWLAGRNGAIARTTDGEHWERVAPPSQAADSGAKFPDWIGVTARDAQIATITERDGRRFATQDGGRTWQAQ